MKPNFTSALTVALITTLSLSVLSSARAQFTYTYYPDNATINNVVETDLAIVGYAGGSYDNNSNPNFTGPSSPTVQVVAGADISGGSNHGVGEMDLFNQSTVNASGGYIYTIVPMNSSTLNLTGSDSGFVLGLDHSVINMGGGSVADLEGQGKQINVSGGTVGALVANVNTDFFGNSLGSSIVNVTGGSITGEADAFNDGILNVFGGLFGGDLTARFGGTINIYGSGLVASLVDPNYLNTFSVYSLSGMLADGSVLTDKRLSIENDGVTYGHSSLHLVNVVPEPGNIALLLGIGTTGTSLLLRRRRK